MSETLFEELQTKIESLPLYQIVILKGQVDRIIEKEEEKKSSDFVSEGLAWLDSIAGSVHREINFDEEKAEWRDEKLGRQSVQIFYRNS